MKKMRLARSGITTTLLDPLAREKANRSVACIVRKQAGKRRRVRHPHGLLCRFVGCEIHLPVFSPKGLSERFLMRVVLLVKILFRTRFSHGLGARERVD